MKNIIKKIPVKWLILSLFSVICLLLTGVILICEHKMQKGLYDQQMAERWSKEGKAAQISVFMAENAVESREFFKGVAQSVEKALLEASLEKENENSRLWIDAISQSGNVVLTSSRATMELNAIGVGGEFFQFHPQKLVKGSLFSEDSMMRDGIVIDEETAWQLFGSSDVAGMQVMIGQVPHFITGVVERPGGRLYEAAGLHKPVCYLAVESLENYGMTEGGYTYEIVLPNPIQNFAFSTMENIFGSDNENVVILENNKRYRLGALFGLIKAFGTRSMSFKGVVYPYWENVARGYEDILVVTLLLKIMLLFWPVIFLILLFICLWKKKTWTGKQIFIRIGDKIYEFRAKKVKEHQKLKESDEIKETEEKENNKQSDA